MPARPQRGSHTRTARIGCRCLHVLALGPLSLQSLEKQLQQAKQQQHVSHLAEARLLPKVLAQVPHPAPRPVPRPVLRPVPHPVAYTVVNPAPRPAPWRGPALPPLPTPLPRRSSDCFGAARHPEAQPAHALPVRGEPFVERLHGRAEEHTARSALEAGHRACGRQVGQQGRPERPR